MNNTDKLFNLMLALFLFVVICFLGVLIVKSNERLDSIEKKLDAICKVDKVECERALTLLLLL